MAEVQDAEYAAALAQDLAEQDLAEQELAEAEAAAPAALEPPPAEPEAVSTCMHSPRHHYDFQGCLMGIRLVGLQGGEGVTTVRFRLPSGAVCTVRETAATKHTGTHTHTDPTH